MIERLMYALGYTPLEELELWRTMAEKLRDKLAEKEDELECIRKYGIDAATEAWRLKLALQRHGADAKARR